MTPLDVPIPWTYYSLRITQSLPSLVSVYAINLIISLQPGNTLSISKALLKSHPLFKSSLTPVSWRFLHGAYFTKFEVIMCVCVSTSFTEPKSVVLILEKASDSHGRFIKTQISGLSLRVSDSWGLIWGPRVCTSNEFPVDVKTVVLEKKNSENLNWSRL